MTMEEIATAAMCNNGIALEATESNCSPVSPPPEAAARRDRADKETGEVRILDYAAVTIAELSTRTLRASRAAWCRARHDAV